jgi:hypothetical protein
VEGAGEAVEAVGSAVDEAAGGGQVVGGEGAAEGGFLVGEEAGEKLGGDGGRGGEVGVGEEVVADEPGVVGIVRAASELDEAAATEIGAVVRALVAEVAAVVVKVEGDGRRARCCSRRALR